MNNAREASAGLSSRIASNARPVFGGTNSTITCVMMPPGGQRTDMPRSVKFCRADERSVDAPTDMLAMMRADDVLMLLSVLDDLGVHYWLDGGWGVDCLLGEQTRQHSDLDLVVHRQDVDLVTAHLSAQGYQVIRDWLPTSVAFRDNSGREVDLHPVDPTPDGGGDQVLPDDDRTWHYAPPVEGSILGRLIRCAPAQDQVLMHTGYAPRAVDFEDVRRLAQRFEVLLPEPFSGDS